MALDILDMIYCFLAGSASESIRPGQLLKVEKDWAGLAGSWLPGTLLWVLMSELGGLSEDSWRHYAWQCLMIRLSRNMKSSPPLLWILERSQPTSSFGSCFNSQWLCESTWWVSRRSSSCISMILLQSAAHRSFWALEQRLRQAATGGDAELLVISRLL